MCTRNVLIMIFEQLCHVPRGSGTRDIMGVLLLQPLQHTFTLMVMKV